MAYQHWSYDTLHRLCMEAFQKFGFTEAEADIIQDVLLTADLYGIESHGMQRMVRYHKCIEKGMIDVHGKPEVVFETPISAVIDAHEAMGQLVSHKAMEMAIEKAKTTGVGIVSVRNSNHYGIAGYYAKMAADQGLLGISMTNTEALVVPTFGKQPMMGTNPIAVALPAEKHLPVLLDMATSRVSRGKLLVSMKKGEPVPDDWALAIDGSRTTDAAQAFRGILLPLGYKGYGMAVIVDMLSGVLNGSGFGVAVDTPKDKPIVGSSFLAIKTEAFCEQGEFRRNVDALIDEIKNVKLEAGTDEVLMPGEIEFRAEIANRKKGGVPIQPFQINELNEQAAPFGFTFEEYL